MIVDCHAHAYPYVGTVGSYKSEEEHLRHLQLSMAGHRQGARRFRDNAPVAEPTLWDGKTPGLEGLLEVNFRIGRFGRFEWEKDGEAYYLQFFPPSVENMTASPERMLAQMQFLGVDKAVLQFNKICGVTNEYLAEIVQRWPDRFRAITVVEENNADREEEILALCHAVRDQGLTGLYFRNPSKNDLDDEKYIPFWEQVEALGIPVVLQIVSTMAKPLDHGSYMAEVVRVHRHLRRFPRIQVVFSQGMSALSLDAAGAIPEELWAMLKEPNVTAELLFPLMYGARWEYPYAEARPIIRQLYEKLGPTKLMWGSDMPNVERYCTYRQSLDYLRKHCDFISPADMDQIIGGNAHRLFFSLSPAGPAP